MPKRLSEEDVELITRAIVKNFANNLALALDERDISRAELARKTNVSRPTITRIMKGDSCPSLATAVIISAALGLSLGRMCGFEKLERKFSENEAVAKAKKSF